MRIVQFVVKLTKSSSDQQNQGVKHGKEMIFQCNSRILIYLWCRGCGLHGYLFWRNSFGVFPKLCLKTLEKYPGELNPVFHEISDILRLVSDSISSALDNLILVMNSVTDRLT